MLDVESVSKSYRSPKRPAPVGGAAAGGVQDISFNVPQGSFFTLLGPSGCGKTTTLRCIAGLEQPDSGVIAINGEAVFDDNRNIAVPINRRSIGMVFQSYAVWPHLSVFENVAFPLRVDQKRRHSERDITARVNETLGTVGLADYGGRSATQLSGGQQQRLALARAIIHRPSLLLLDEPLSNLDVKLREDMRTELKRLQKDVGLTAIYVTHDQSEALAMSDRIAVLNRGRLVQCGTPDSIFHKPENRFVAGFVGAANLIDADMLGTADVPDRHTARLRDGQVIACTRIKAGQNTGPVSICLRPEAIRVLPRQPSASAGELNMLPGRIETRTFLGNTTMLQISAAGSLLQVMANPSDDNPMDGDVTVQFSAASAIALDC